ncbi:hypothetical protein [uncultured Ruminococcus sp.]|uniref:hypothetical protein n=1 Tax=uncultured Ruminococcus sp. TaxID=165186 RepID=UPI0025FDE6E3|nr:hypothetical protein [uncultured Ruminococcus sp.]
MSFILSKCATCKKYKLIDESPWAICDIYPEEIPDKYYQLDIDKENVTCPNYEYNPDWNKKDK